MANKTLLTAGARLFSVQQDYYSPVLVIPPSNSGLPLHTSIYCFLSRVDPWVDVNNPPTPTEDQISIKNILKSMFVAKQLTTSDISPVIQRIDWTSGTTYDYYDDYADMLATDSNGFLVKTFYVKNRYDQVFKCLWNNNDGLSTYEPFFEPGSYNTNNIYQSLDGYKWKFMFTIDSGSKIKFMDENWIPVPIGSNTYNPTSNNSLLSVVSTPGVGSVDVINIIEGGSGYDPVNSAITIKIVGDGTGANAEVGTYQVVGGSITDIIVTSPGSNYNYANVVISSANGSGAVAIAPASPIGGHGSNPISELGCSHIMYTAQFNSTEQYNGVNIIPTNIDYYQMGLLVNPSDLTSGTKPASNSIYQITENIFVAQGLGSYTSDEIVYQTPDNTFANSTFTGTVLSFDSAADVVYVINTTGTPTTSQSLHGLTSRTVRTLLNYVPPKYIISSGNIIYIENMIGVQRSSDGIEQFRIVLGY